MPYIVSYNEKQTYIAHFNKNHSPKDGKFTSGDGDGDGIINERKQYKRNKNKAISKFVDSFANLSLGAASGVFAYSAIKAGGIKTLASMVTIGSTGLFTASSAILLKQGMDLLKKNKELAANNPDLLKKDKEK